MSIPLGKLRLAGPAPGKTDMFHTVLAVGYAASVATCRTTRLSSISLAVLLWASKVGRKGRVWPISSLGHGWVGLWMRVLLYVRSRLGARSRHVRGTFLSFAGM